MTIQPRLSLPQRPLKIDSTFDLTELDHSREIYFLPGLDRLGPR